MTTRTKANTTTKKSSGMLPNQPVVFNPATEFDKTFDYWDYLMHKISYDRPLLHCEVVFVKAFANEVKQNFKNRKEVANA